MCLGSQIFREIVFENALLSSPKVIQKLSSGIKFISIKFPKVFNGKREEEERERV